MYKRACARDRASKWKHHRDTSLSALARSPSGFLRVTGVRRPRRFDTPLPSPFNCIWLTRCRFNDCPFKSQPRPARVARVRTRVAVWIFEERAERPSGGRFYEASGGSSYAGRMCIYTRAFCRCFNILLYARSLYLAR